MPVKKILLIIRLFYVKAKLLKLFKQAIEHVVSGQQLDLIKSLSLPFDLTMWSYYDSDRVVSANRSIGVRRAALRLTPEVQANLKSWRAEANAKLRVFTSIAWPKCTAVRCTVRMDTALYRCMLYNGKCKIDESEETCNWLDLLSSPLLLA